MADNSQSRGGALNRFIDYVMQPGHLPSIGKELAYAVADIRQKVVEEGMYGRPTTPPIDTRDGDPLGRSMEPVASPVTVNISFADLCRDIAKTHPAAEQDRGRDHGPER